MSKVKDTFFGGAEKKAGRAITAAGRQSAQITKEMFEDVKAGLAPFQAGGVPAFERQQALSGALGPEAQRAAFDAFEESPGVDFLREQGLRMIESGAAASGGLGGGDRLRELVKFSQGLALQDLSDQFNRLGAVTGTGLTAAQALGGVSGQASSGIAQGLQSGARGRAAGLTGQAAGFRAGVQQLAGGIAGAGGGGGFMGGLQGTFGV